MLKKISGQIKHRLQMVEQKLWNDTLLYYAVKCFAHSDVFTVCSDADVKTLQLQLGLPSPEQKDSDKSLATPVKESSSKFQMVML